MHAHDPQRTGTLGTGGLDEIALAQAERGAAHQPGHRGPAEQGDDGDDPIQADMIRLGERFGDSGLFQVDSGQHDQQRQQRQGDDPIGHSHEQGIEAAAEIAGNQTESRAENRRSQGRGNPHQQRHLSAVEQAHQHVAAQLVGAQGMGEGRRGETLQQVDRLAVDTQNPGDQRRRYRQNGENSKHDKAGQGQLVAAETPHRQAEGTAQCLLRAHRYQILGSSQA